ncbi:MAG: GntR family transcriptional regulator [Oscillospiraceae bacterium]|nr:GntR family transcriptional regulator [Oscillospiraceae bacterium]
MDSTLYKKIESYILDIISQNASIPDFKLPSERTLSLKFDTSRKPVRRAYDNLIQKGYVVNIHGKGYFIGSQVNADAALSTTWNNPKISLIIPSITTQYCHDILAGVNDFCSNHQVELTILVSDDSPEKEDRLLRSAPLSGAKGIILFPADHDNTYDNELLKLCIRKYPLVLVDRMLPNIHASFISSENHQAMVNAVEFLQQKNFQNLVYVTAPSTIASTTDTRINGFTHGLLRHYKVAKPQNLLVLEGSPLQMKNTVVKYLQNYPETEIIIVPGTMRLTVLMAAQELGIQIPRDLKLMIFDDELSPTERISLKPYILKQDGYRIGYYAAESLYNQLFGDLRPVTKMLPVAIIDTSKNEK